MRLSLGREVGGYLIIWTGFNGRFNPHSFIAILKIEDNKFKSLLTVAGVTFLNRLSRYKAIFCGVISLMGCKNKEYLRKVFRRTNSHLVPFF